MSAGSRTLATRPEATTFQVDDLLDAVRRGRVRLPRFQRGLRWDNRDRFDLLDSVRRGFPVGTLLLWRREAPAGSVEIGRFRADAPMSADALWVVDGQQRITTLVDALLVPESDDGHSLTYSLGDQTFARRGGQMTLFPGVRLPLSVVLDAKNLSRWCQQHQLGDADFDAALELGKRLREYRVPAYVIETDDLDVIRSIFDRTNRAGKRLTSIEVFDALFGGFHPDDDDPLRLVEESEAARSFGGLSRTVLFQCFLAVAGLPLDRDFAQPLDVRREQIPSLAARTREALVRAVSFLTGEARIPAGNLLPYTLPLPVLVKFFDRFPEPHMRNRRLLRRWLWRGIVALSLAGSSVGLRTHVDAVDADESQSVQTLLTLAPRHTRPELFDIGELRAGTAKAAACFCALAAQGPRDLESGDPCLFAEGGRPDHTLTSIPGEERRGLSARFFHPRHGKGALVDTILRATDNALLATHGLTTSAIACLRKGDADGFFAERTRTLQALVNAFFSGLAELGADDSPPLTDLDADDDESTGTVDAALDRGKA